MTRMSTQIRHGATIVLGLILVVGFATTKLTAQLLPSKLTDEVPPVAKVDATADSKVEEVETIQLPKLTFTNINTVVSVPDGGTVLHGSRPMNPQTVQVPDAETTGLMMTVTPGSVIQDEEEEPLAIGTIGELSKKQCAQCPSQCQNACPNCTEVKVPDGGQNGLLSIVTPRIIIQHEDEPLPIGTVGGQCPGQCDSACPNCPASETCPAAQAAFASTNTPGVSASDVQSEARRPEEMCPAVARAKKDADASPCPFGDACQGQCATEMPDSGYARLRLPPAPAPKSQCDNAQCTECEQDHCAELAATLSDSLSDSNIHPQARRDILDATMKLLVINANLEAKAEIAQMQLVHEREVALIRGHMYQLQGQMATIGEVQQWMAPLYTRQNQTQQQMQNLESGLQLINQSMRSMARENTPQPAMQSRQPYVNPQQWTQNPNRYPQPSTIRNQYVPQERWSQLPSHMENPPVRDDKSTTYTPPSSNPNAAPARTETYRKTTSQVAPKRLSDFEIRRERLRNEISRVERELKQLDDGQLVKAVSWNEPLADRQSNSARISNADYLPPVDASNSRPLQPRIQPVNPGR